MTDAVPNPLDSLIEKYETGVANLDSDVRGALETRSQLEAQSETLTDAQVQRIEDADKYLIQNAATIAPKVSHDDAVAHPANEWWWHLDVLSGVSDYYGGGTTGNVPGNRGSIAARIFTVVEVVVLLVAVGLLLHNLGVQPFAPGPTPTSTPFPTDVPTAVPTINAAAFDMTTAKLYKAENDVLEIQVPAAWTTPPTNRPGVYDVAYGDVQSPSVFIEVRVNKAADFYKGIDSTGKATTPESALQALIAANSGGALKFSPVQAAKVGKLDGYMLTASQAASTGANGPIAASEYDIRAALLPNTDQIAYVQTFSVEAMWTAAQPVVVKMLDSLVLNPQNVPTATPTATLHPLLITATAVQTLIIGLTPTATATSTPTITPTPAPVTPGTGTPVAAAGSPVTLPDGLQYVDTVVGTGDPVVAGKALVMKYTGKLTDGTVFDSNNDGFPVTIGAGHVIKGWDEGIIGMKVGGKRTLTIPPALGYGAQGQGKIPANATLIFDVELISIK